MDGGYLSTTEPSPRAWSWRSRRTAVIGAAAVLTATVGVVVGLAQAGSGGHGHPSKVDAVPATTTSTLWSVSPTTSKVAVSTAVASTTTRATSTTATVPPTNPAPVVTVTTLPPAPAAPVDVVAYAGTAGTDATVAWHPAGGGIPAVSYAVATQPATLTVTVPASQASASLTGLSPSTFYLVTVRAVDAAGGQSATATTQLVNGATPAQATDWSQYQGNDLHSGQGVQPGPATGGNVSTWSPASGPTVADISPLVGPNGDVYVETYDPGANGSASATVYVLSGSGSARHVLWSWTLSPASIEGALTVAPDGGFYFINGQGLFSVAPGGTTRWELKDPGPEPEGQVTVSMGVLYFLDYHKTVWAVDASTGHGLWQATLPVGSCANLPAPTLSVDRKTVYAESGDGQLYALAAGPGGGRVDWSYRVPAPPAGQTVCLSPSAVGADGTVYLGWCDGSASSGSGTCGVDAVDPSGTRLWRHSMSSPYTFSLGVTATGLVVFGEGNGVTALHANDGSTAWSYQLSSPGDQVTGPPAIARDGTIYLESVSSVLALTNAGQLLWQAPETSGLGRAGTGLALDPAGNLYAVVVDSNNNGRLVAFA